MSTDDLAAKVIEAIQGNPEGVKEISDALANGDAEALKRALARHTSIDISAQEAESIVAEVRASPQGPAAYVT